MKKILLATLFVCLIGMSCEKETNDTETINTEVTVKQIDAICGDAIFEIIDTNYKQLGEQNFEYKGAIYNGVFASRLTCTNLTAVAHTDVNPNAKYYKVTISKTPFENCGVAICAATLIKMPTIFYYIK